MVSFKEYLVLKPFEFKGRQYERNESVFLEEQPASYFFKNQYIGKFEKKEEGSPKENNDLLFEIEEQDYRAEQQKKAEILMNSESNPVSNQKPNHPIAPQNEAWGAEDIGGSDITIPRISVMQNSSQMVSSEIHARPGEFRNSVTGELLGSTEKPIEIIIFKVTKAWETYENGEYKGQIPRTAQNESLEMEEQASGVLIKRVRTINAFCVLPKDLKEGAFPHLLTFKSTSFKAGRRLCTMLAKLAQLNQPVAAKTFFIGAELEKNNKGSYFVLTVNEGRKTTPDERKVAKEWYQLIGQSSQNVKVDDENEIPGETI